MPYFVFAVKPFAQLECLGEHAAYRDASALAKSLRAERRARGAATAQGESIRIMFAETVAAAEDLLLQPRDAPPPGDT
jgi:hypothetical protein